MNKSGTKDPLFKNQNMHTYAYLVFLVYSFVIQNDIRYIMGHRSCVSFTQRFTDPESPGSFRFRKRIERLPGRCALRYAITRCSAFACHVVMP